MLDYKMRFQKQSPKGFPQKKVLLKMLQNSQGSTCKDSIFSKGLQPATLLEKGL